MSKLQPLIVAEVIVVVFEAICKVTGTKPHTVVADIVVVAAVVEIIDKVTSKKPSSAVAEFLLLLLLLLLRPLIK